VTITRVVDGGLPSDGCAGADGTSSPKVIELYVDGTVDFTGYEYVMEANGGAENFQVTDLTDFGSISNQFIYIVTLGETTFDEILPGATKVVSGTGTFNGDDYIRITNGTTILDEFGVLGTDGSGEAWEYLDTYASRSNGVSANSTFTIGEWSFGTVNEFDGTDCATLTAAVNFGGYTLSLNNFNVKSFSVYPNPTNIGSVNVVSSQFSNEKLNIAVYDVLGKQVMNTKMNSETLDVSLLNTGVYIMKITQGKTISTKKLVIN